MRILVDILHPAHVHVFRNFIAEMTRRGHEVMVTARDKDRSLELLDRYGLAYEHISDQRPGTLGMAVEMSQRTGRLLQVMRRFDPDVMTGIMGPSIAVAGALRRVPAVVFYDTEFATQTNWFVYPLAHSVCTPDCYRGKVRGTHVTYAGYHELAYLHPNRFQPDPAKLDGFGLHEDEPYSIVRFVSWEAVHDRSEKGLTLAQKRELIELLGRRGRVLVSSEAALPDDLAEYQVKGPVEDIHHLLAHAQLVVGESATMSSEAAVLGVPAIFIATTDRGYTEDEEKRYGLVRHFREEQYEIAVRAIDDLLAASPREAGGVARARLLADKIDVTQWMVDYFETTFAATASRGW
jgi:predicted glycosyltransferase